MLEVWSLLLFLHVDLWKFGEEGGDVTREAVTVGGQGLLFSPTGRRGVG